MNQKEFMKLVTKKRLKMGLNQYQFAKMIPINKTSYSKIENDKQGLNFFLIKRIATILDIDLNSIKDEKINPKYYD